MSLKKKSKTNVHLYSRQWSNTSLCRNCIAIKILVKANVDFVFHILAGRHTVAQIVVELQLVTVVIERTISFYMNRT